MIRLKQLSILLLAGAFVAGAGAARPAVVAQGAAPQVPVPVPLDKLTLPKGFKISVFAEDVRNARAMALGANGTVFVGSMGARKVYALVDKNGDGVADEVKVIVPDARTPAGLVFHKGSLYFSTVTQIFRLDDIENHLDAPPTPVAVGDPLPNNQGHNWRFLAIGPDGLLYIGLGSPCNFECEGELLKDPRLATIARMKLDGTGFEVFAHGVRNTVGFDWHPVTRELWFTDNGRDDLGDDVPNDELNIASKAGLNFGYPYCHQGDTPDPTYPGKHACSEFVAPVQKMGPHVAALGLRFYTGSMFPAEYKNAAFIAQHGSWNRTTPLGYRVMVAKNDGHKVTDYQEFLGGLLHGIRGAPRGNRVNGDAYGRPADVLMLKDGSMLISDDTGGRIFRITYSK